jgi:hypothetical protein
MDTSIQEVHRLAQHALDIATQAKFVGESAQKAVDYHEKTCAERYLNINGKLSELHSGLRNAVTRHETSIEKIYIVLDQLRATAHKAGGLDIAFRYLCLVIGAVGVVWGIMK